MPEEDEFKIVDKRRMMSEEEVTGKEVESEGEQPAEKKEELEPAPEATTDQQAGAAENRKEPSDTKASASSEVLMAVQIAMKIFVEHAYLLMGLIRHPETKQIVMDMKQARIAIDCYKAVLETTQEHFNELEKKELRRILSELQINYAAQMKKAPLTIK